MKPFTSLSSRLVPLLIDNVDTDQIIPASYLKVTDRSGLGAGLFANWRYGAEGKPRAEFALNRPEYRGAEILLAGENFGCGSSREHAAWALLASGFRAVVSTRFADIFRNNALKNGLLAVTVAKEIHRALVAAVEADPGVTVTIDLREQEITLPEGGKASFAVDAFARRCLLDGVDELGYLLAREEQITVWEAEHPPAIDTHTETPQEVA